MEIAVVGTVMLDEIVTLDGARRKSFGGILYNTMALLVLLRPDDRIRLICQIGEDHFPVLDEHLFAHHSRIDTSSIRSNPRGTDTNSLIYRSVGARDERITILSDPLTPADLETARRSQAVIVNFINGREVSLEVLRGFAADYTGHLHLDIHNLGRLRDADGKPAASSLPDWEEWVRLFDTVQLNEWEAEVLFGSVPRTEEEQRQVVRRLISAGGRLRCVCLTMGEGGSSIAHRLPDGSLRWFHIPALPVSPIVDTTGCGDSFSAGFVVGLLRWNNVARAVVLATVLSGLNCTRFGLEGLAGIRNVSEAEGLHYSRLIAQIEDGWNGSPLP